LNRAAVASSLTQQTPVAQPKGSIAGAVGSGNNIPKVFGKTMLGKPVGSLAAGTLTARPQVSPAKAGALPARKGSLAANVGGLNMGGLAALAPVKTPLAANVPELSEDEVAAFIKKKCSSWQTLKDSSPVYALVGELQEDENKVMDSLGMVDNLKLTGYFERLLVNDMWKNKDLKDWPMVWYAMDIPEECQAEALMSLLQTGLTSEMAECVADILAELVKRYRVTIKSAEEAISGLFMGGGDQESCLEKFLLLMLPKSPTSSWGLNRSGWTWQEWWETSEGILATLDAESAFECLSALLIAIEKKCGKGLSKQNWDAKRLIEVRKLLCTLGNIENESDLKTRVKASVF